MIIYSGQNDSDIWLSSKRQIVCWATRHWLSTQHVSVNKTNDIVQTQIHPFLTKPYVLSVSYIPLDVVTSRVSPAHAA